ncbi:peptide ABC transporter substrate-binding protein [Altererythrobacter aquaemixtae]|uniref:Peptide ABC transporter substrate-binding protein n=1 Tax=Pontixanthobacter aquaemixtae TaxID=1958940 RepID=A0A845A0J7_9SPHN|nr:peptide ABC transporter substrate-binding protein [Pontixanthobacter aquaemixtae]
MRAATAEGLVGLNQVGEVVPALAERWIVTDDGMSYIFRLRNSDWSDGTALTSENVKSALERNIEQLRGTSLGVDLSIISEIRAMTGRVIEIRLKSPMPQFLQLFAQPELGLRRNGAGTGPMLATASDGAMMLSAASPEQRGMPMREDWEQSFRQVRIESMPAEQAADRFEAGEADAVFNGRLLSLPVADTGPLSRGTVRLDPVFGLFGLQINNSNGPLAERSLREAIAMGIDRDTLLQRFSLGGWVPSTRIVPTDLPGRASTASERWLDQPFDARRAEAKRRIIGWRASNLSATVRLSIAMPDSPGTDMLFAELQSDFEEIGVTLEMAPPGARGDLELVDRLARYADDRWFLNQFNCSLKRGMCSPEADVLARSAISETDPQIRTELLAQAEQQMLESQIYIPIGAPIRWSLIRGGIDGFTENNWGLHPLFPLASRPI